MGPDCEKTRLDALLAREGPPPRDALARGAWLRRFLAPDEAARAGEQLELRARAAARFAQAERLWLTSAGLEQATHPHVAAARAREIAELRPSSPTRPRLVLDATCGLGGESAALVDAGFAVVAADRDATTARCARHNLAVWGASAATVVVADALAEPLRSASRALLVVDPSRRAAGRRSLDPREWSPAWPALAERLVRFAGACVKLAPGVRPEELDAALPVGLPRRWQWTSRAGELAELCLWTDALAVGPGRTALLLGRDGEERARFAGPSARAPDGEPLAEPLAAAWIAVPDPALVASGLLGPVARAAGLAPLGSGIGFVGGPAPAGVPGLRDLAVRGACRLDRKAVRRLLGEHDIGPVRVLARGLSESAGELEQRLAGPGTGRGLLVAARTDSGRCVWLVDEGASRTAGDTATGD
jgi:SAM-dependent methyltransferase